MKFTVYQIDLDDDQMENPELRNMYLDCIMNPTEEVIRPAREFYFKVAEIVANDFEEVFEIGNIGPVESIHKIRPMRSISVGDVIKCQETGEHKFVAPFGFGSVSF